MSDPRLDVFSTALRRLILCGGDGLPAAYGPTVESRPFVGPRPGTWCGDRMVAIEGRHGASGVDRLDDLDVAAWSLPLDHWAPRLALVAARLLHPRHHYLCAHIEAADKFITLTRVRFTDHERGLAMGDWTWSMAKGASENAPTPLPTLPSLLTQHAPVVALLLAIDEVSRV